MLFQLCYDFLNQLKVLLTKINRNMLIATYIDKILITFRCNSLVGISLPKNHTHNFMAVSIVSRLGRRCAANQICNFWSFVAHPRKSRFSRTTSETITWPEGRICTGPHRHFRFRCRDWGGSKIL